MHGNARSRDALVSRGSFKVALEDNLHVRIRTLVKVHEAS
jgi:hypothetical protein